MVISDENGNFYTVKHPDKLISSVDNDVLITIMQISYAQFLYNHEISEELKIELNDSVEYLKTHISSVLTPEIVETALKDITPQNLK